MEEKEKAQRKSGVLLHPTSLPSRFGIGDFGPDAYEFIHFLEKAGQSLWQILPLTPTSFGDSPYQSFSTFAGNPLLISPELLFQEGYLTLSNDLLFFSDTKVDYENISAYKRKLFQRAYQGFLNSATPKEKADFATFCSKEDYWLRDYALFVALKEHYITERKEAGETEEFLAFQKRTSSTLSPSLQLDYYYGGVWCTWEKGLIDREPATLKKWETTLCDAIGYHMFLQYCFSHQWTAVKSYANAKGIEIIGDVPIFVAYDSADVWVNKELFYMDSQGFPTVVAGVPPDYFSATGQLWGNPLYNWEAHEKTNFAWWVARIKATLNQVDILRIDHFRGFDEYWAIPFEDKDATGGKWQKAPGQKLFNQIKKSLGDPLPIIAEDLGIITEGVNELRMSQGFPGMRVLHFAFDDTAKNDYLPHNYEKETVVYTGTHDNDTSIGWYEKAPEKAKDYYRRYMNVSGNDPAWDLIRLAMGSAANYAIFPLQDVMSLGTEHRMNTPSTATGNWQFRYRSSDLTEGMAQGLLYLSQIFDRNEHMVEAVETEDIKG